MWNDLKGFVQRCHARVLTLDLKREEGQGLVEYALIISLVSIASIFMLTGLGTKIGEVFTTVTTAL